MKKKNELKLDTVISDTIHVGIELELFSTGEHSGHDDEACAVSMRDNLASRGAESLLRNYVGLSRGEASAVAPHFDVDSYIDKYMSEWSCDGDCGFEDSQVDRDELARRLRILTGNTSFKVVKDGSIDCADGADAEVCWNYYASKETVKDNEKILNFLKDEGLEFNSSCGLHINLNNYLGVPKEVNRSFQRIKTRTLDFLFNYVAPSRRDSSYCNNYSVASNDKYSMIYNQGDRLEFRFFSPTLDHEKLNAYVSLAHFIYKRLAGKQCKMPRKLEAYFRDKMKKVNKLDDATIDATIRQTNEIRSLKEMHDATLVRPNQINERIASVLRESYSDSVSGVRSEHAREMGVSFDDTAAIEQMVTQSEAVPF